MVSHNSGSGNGAQRPRLPKPGKRRWQPLRSGFVDIYKYDREEFHYENGRLLLRGNNGTGKSRVLALQLPFLLEGETGPHRVEPDADQAKRIEWNLLMGKYPERTGYTWIEFGRRDAPGKAAPGTAPEAEGPDGTDRYLSLGCGMTAVEGRTGVLKWFFITDQRIGIDLHLENEFKQVLTRERLQEAIGNRGQVFTAAHLYRQAVDQALFRLGEFRFTTLMNLLVRLRRPQLTRHFNEDELSDILSEALPPVGSHILADVSEAFRSLETDRLQLDSFISANHAVVVFLKDYLRYIQVAARRRADHARDRQGLYENRMRQIRIEQSNEQIARTELDTVSGEIARREFEATTIDSEIVTLLSSPHMKDAEALDRAERDAKQRTEETESAAESLERLTASRKENEQRLTSAGRLVEASGNELAAWVAKTTQAARSALVAEDFEAAIAALGFPEFSGISSLKQAQRAAEEAAIAQSRRVETLRRLNRLLEKADEHFRRASHEEGRLRGHLDAAMEIHRRRHDELRRATAELLDAYRNWAGALVELYLGHVEELFESLTLWCETMDGPNPAQHVIQNASQDAIQTLAGIRSETDHELGMATRQLAGLQAELDRLASGRHEAPPLPYTRDPLARAGRAGAPLWLLCDFDDMLDPSMRAGFEAALESAGLLDAWITPDGLLLDRDVHDTILTAGSSPLALADSHLGLFLNPSIDPADEQAATVSLDTVRSVLRHIGTAPESGLVWVAPNGEWQIGPLHGAWMKPEAEHIGQGAREVNRRRRMERLSAEIGELKQAIRKLESQLAVLRERAALVREEVNSAPSPERIGELHAEIAAAIKNVDSFRGQLEEAERRTTEARRERNAAIGIRDETARDLGLLEWVERLDEIDNALNAYRESKAALWPVSQLHLERREHARNAEARLSAAIQSEERQITTLRQCELAGAAAVSERDTLKRTVGAAVEQVTRQLVEARLSLKETRRLEKSAIDQRSRLEAALARTGEALRHHTVELESEARTRDEAVQQFKVFAETRLLHLAVPLFNDTAASTWSITRSVEAARETISSLENLDATEAAWERLQNGVARQYSELLQHLHSHECRSSGTWCGDIFVATISYGAQERSIEELRDWLTHEVHTRQELLAAREREVLENHLIGDVADHLNGLLHQGESLVHDMNAELESRPTSTGMKLRFTWRVREDEHGLAEARKTLMRRSGTWTPAESQKAGAFLQSGIQRERTAAEASSWQESLGLALDYRKWHMFGVERFQDGKWKLLNKRTHGTGSGGEKAIALTLPQFAAAAAYYRSADPLAPRLILLDEAFAGIDTDMRSKCMGFIETFDLDFIMTSEREWACYPTLPGVAIYQLSTRPGIDAIGLTRWVWNGEEKALDTHGS